MWCVYFHAYDTAFHLDSPCHHLRASVIPRDQAEELQASSIDNTHHLLLMKNHDGRTWVRWRSSRWWSTPSTLTPRFSWSLGPSLRDGQIWRFVILLDEWNHWHARLETDGLLSSFMHRKYCLLLTTETEEKKKTVLKMHINKTKTCGMLCVHL